MRKIIAFILLMLHLVITSLSAQLDSIPLVFVEGGRFLMGNDTLHGDRDEVPVHEVIVRDFYMGQFEITNRQFCAFLNEMGNQEEGGVTWINLYPKIKRGGVSPFQFKDGRYWIKPGYEEHPVVRVSWYGAKAFCKWLSEKKGKLYRLPTEAEWEYAARGGIKGEGYEFAGSPNLGEVAWRSSDNKKDLITRQVGLKKPNELDIYDLSGNVWEWCQDWYAPYPRDGARRDVGGPAEGITKVCRGGRWHKDSADCRIANRNYFRPDYRVYELGFRVVAEIVQNKLP